MPMLPVFRKTWTTSYDSCQYERIMSREGPQLIKVEKLLSKSSQESRDPIDYPEPRCQTHSRNTSAPNNLLDGSLSRDITVKASCRASVLWEIAAVSP